MPITAEYTWAESQTTIQLQVPLKGQATSKVDVFATECYLKISFPPYLLELDLHGCIDSSQPRARTERGILIIKAKKKEGHIGIWGILGSIADRKSEPEVRIRREESIKEQLKREQELKERIALRKHQDERLALRSQMNVEEAERRRIEDIKADQKEQAEREVYQAFAELEANKNNKEPPPPPPALAQPKPTIKSLPAPSSPPLLDIAAPAKRDGSKEGPLSTIIEASFSTQEGSPNAVAAASNTIDGGIVRAAVDDGHDNGADYGGNEKDNDERNSSPNYYTGRPGESQNSPLLDDEIAQAQKKHDEDELDDGAMSYIPDPRAPIGVVPIGFTTRLFPTPLRESKVADESAWIMKNRRHLHKNHTLVGRLPGGKHGDVRDLAVDISESDPIWLKGKGDDLYRGGDFLGAANAYTAALDAGPENPAPCLSNRAACHLRLGNAAECAADCGAALEILQSVPESGPSQAKALARRALAYRELGHYRLSLEDCRAALAFSPGDPALTTEAARSEPLAISETAKKEAVARFSSGDIGGACDLYDAALAAMPALPSCLSNRAACHLALGRPAECVRDCTSALDLLSADPSPGGVNSGWGVGAIDGGPAGVDAPNTCCLTDGALPSKRVPPPGSAPPAGSEKRRLWVLATVMRRGRANLELGRLEEVLQDYRAASALAPDDKAIARDVTELERRAQEENMALTY